MDPALAVATLALIASVASVVFAARQATNARKANMLSVAVNAFKEFRTPEFREHREYIMNRLSSDDSIPYQQLPADARRHVMPISHYCETIGILVSFGLVDEELVVATYGETIGTMWLRLAPFVRKERMLRRTHFFGYFEDLATRIARRSPFEIQRRRQLQSMTAADEDSLAKECEDRHRDPN
jgi:hypothetical protein